MSAINKIRIHNFKAFYTSTEPDEIVLNGKHLLMYGENGSGKSSIYWALYTLFQSETKSTEEIAKYFTPTHDEQLLNFNYLNHRPDFKTDADGKITNPTDIGKNAEVEVLLEDGTSLKIDKDGIYESIINKIQDLHRHSDFITHRLLVNFYNFRNSKEINLWEVFVRDFFPFLRIDRGKGDLTLWQKLKEIENNPPFNINIATKRFKRSKSKSRQKWISDEIKKLNEDIEYWIGRINVIANDVYKNELKIEDEILIYIQYSEPFRYEHYKNNEFVKDSITYIQGTGYAGFNNPKLILNIRRKNQDGTFSLIHRPQAYLNEAKITQIALSIRFSLLHKTIKPDYPGQFLALDDLLISLDMSNRDVVLDAILNIYSKRFKIYFFTHERGFFNYTLDKIKNIGFEKEWLIKEIYADSANKKPFINSLPNKLKKADYFILNHDYPAAGIYLRIRCEEIFDNLYPDKEKYKLKQNNEGIYETQLQSLNDKISNLEFFCNQEGIDYSEFKDLKTYKSVILNSLAHNDINSPIYRIELIKVKDVLEKLEKYERSISIYKPQNTFTLKFKKADGNDYIIGITITDHIKIIEKKGEFKRASNFCKAYISYISDNGSEQKNLKIEKRSIKDLVQEICDELEIKNEISIESEMTYNRDGSTIQSRINALANE
ncbi:hypothetical protein [Flavobacterium sp. NRK1]|uniref:hypothetical protein n=1 Tax=Flavobacterium sp. NRK1 TaxID=2954929 RepID=UPI002092C02C|nr:hypothetical protein [Flavobacterium sp. NRK1]MCO6147384.1 hypothetical protein [Flavobacterium sp. NRK1]